MSGDPEDYDDFDPDDELDYDAGDDCGRWINGKLGKHCSMAGTEFCDWECPHRDRSFLNKVKP